MTEAATRKHVLLVEDEPTIAITLSYDLEDHGYQVTHLAHGDQAVRRLAACRFDAVISDIRLPGADGFQVMRAARLQVPAVEVLLITACAVPSPEPEPRAQRCAILQKPFSNDTVLDWLAAACP